MPYYKCATCCYATNSYDKFLAHGMTHDPVEVAAAESALADRQKTATEVAKAKAAAARRAYAAGSRDGAREMRLAAARLAEAAGCICWKLSNTTAKPGEGVRLTQQVDGSILVDKPVADHDPRCPAALAEAIRRLPDGGAGEAGPVGESPLAGWGGGS